VLEKVALGLFVPSKIAFVRVATPELERDPVRLKHIRHWRGNWRILVE
jgi:hypothetical protein